MKLTQELSPIRESMFRGEAFPTNAWFYDLYREGEIPDGAIIGLFRAYLKNDEDQYIVYDSGVPVGVSKKRYNEKY